MEFIFSTFLLYEIIDFRISIMKLHQYLSDALQNCRVSKNDLW